MEVLNTAGIRLFKYLFCSQQSRIFKINMEKNQTVRGGGFSLGLGHKSCQQGLKYQICPCQRMTGAN